MAGTVQYLWEVSYYDGSKNRLVFSLAPVKTRILFNNGTYRDLPGGTPASIGATTIPVETAITQASPGWPGPPLADDSATSITVVNAAANQLLADDQLHIAPRAKIEPYDCWVFTNSAGDVVCSPRCNDVRDWAPYQPKPMQSGIQVVDVSSTDFTLLRPAKHLYAVGAGDVIVTYLDGNTDTITVQANSLREIGWIATVVKVGTTATGLLVW